MYQVIDWRVNIGFYLSAETTNINFAAPKYGFD